MNRSSFLKILGLGAVGAVTANKILASSPESDFTDASEWESRLEDIKAKDAVNIKSYSSIEKILKDLIIQDENGNCYLKYAE